MACNDDSLGCGDGQGVCSNGSNICVCLDPGRQDAGDFRISTGCTVHILGLQVVWIVNGMVWGFCLVLSVLAIIGMKRKSANSLRFDMLTAVLSLCSSVFGLALAVVELTSSKRIGVDLASTVVFSIHHSFLWVNLVIKPIVKSEYSISGFAASRTIVSARRYKRFFPLILFIAMLGNVFPIVSVFHPNLERPMLVLYLSCVAIVTTIMGLVAIASINAATEELKRALANPSMSRRISLKNRVGSFFLRARRVMLIATASIFILDAILLVFAICEPCSRYGWIFIPSALIFCGIWFCRNLIISLQVSWRNHHLIGTSHHTVINNNQEGQANSKEITVVGGPISPTAATRKTSTSTTGRSASSRSKSSQGRKKKPLMRKMKNMSAVQEGDNEGTVVMTQVDGLTRFFSSKFSLHQEETTEDNIPEESGDLGSHQATEHEMSTVTEERPQQ